MVREDKYQGVEKLHLIVGATSVTLFPHTSEELSAASLLKINK